MIRFQTGNIAQPPQQTSRQPIFSAPVLMALCLLCLQKGCIWNPDIAPAQAAWDTHTTIVSGVSEQEGTASGWNKSDLTRHHPLLTPVALPTLPKSGQVSTNPSLRQASGLLRQAATLLEQNDRAAVPLILQAITILKQEIMQDGQSYEYDRVSLSPLPSTHDAWRQDSSTIFSSLRHARSRYLSTHQCDNQSAIPFLWNIGCLAGQETRNPRVE